MVQGADRPGYWRRLWRYVSNLAEAMDMDDTTMLSRRVAVLERQVAALRNPSNDLRGGQ